MRRLLLHGLGLAILLAVLWPIATDGGEFHADEGAVLAQARVLEQRSTWTAPNPQPELDPEMEALPLELSERFEGGQWAPYLKHPVYPLLVRGGAVFGTFGWVLPGILGTAAAGIACGMLAERIRPGSGPIALWCTGVASPLLFQTFVVQAHALGAGLAALAAVAADRVLVPERRERTIATIGMCAAGVAAASVRTESLFLVAALCAGVVAAARLSRRAIVVATTVGLVVLASWRIENLLIPVLGGGEQLGGVLAGRDSIESGGDPLGTFRLTVLDATYGSGTSSLLGSLGTVAAWLTALAARRKAAVVVLVGSAVAVAGHLMRLDLGGLVPGLAVATPLLAGLVGLRRSTLRQPTAELLVVASLVFAAAVTFTQYDNGGGATWGGRFFAVGLPLIVPLAVVGWYDLLHGLDGGARRALQVASAVSVVVLGVLAVASMRDQRSAVEDLVDSVVAARAEAGSGAAAPVISTSGIPTRFAWEHIDNGVWLTIEPRNLSRYLERLGEASDRAVLITLDPDLDLPVVERRHRVIQQRGRFVFELALS